MTRRRSSLALSSARSSVLPVGVLAPLLWSAASLARAEEPAPEGDTPATEDAAESRATSFQAVQGPTAEQVPGGNLLVAAYAVVLVLLVAYVGRLGALQRKNQSELARLSAAVERARKA